MTEQLFHKTEPTIHYSDDYFKFINEPIEIACSRTQTISLHQFFVFLFFFIFYFLYFSVHSRETEREKKFDSELHEIKDCFKLSMQKGWARTESTQKCTLLRIRHPTFNFHSWLSFKQHRGPRTWTPLNSPTVTDIQFRSSLRIKLIKISRRNCWIALQIVAPWFFTPQLNWCTCNTGSLFNCTSRIIESPDRRTEKLVQNGLDTIPRAFVYKIILCRCRASTANGKYSDLDLRFNRASTRCTGMKTWRKNLLWFESKTSMELRSKPKN